MAEGRDNKGRFVKGNNEGTRFGKDDRNPAEIGKRGGLKKGTNSQRRRRLRETMRVWLDMPAEDALRKAMMKMGIDKDGCTNRMAVTVGLGRRAVKGDIAAYNAIRDIMGENPDERIKGEGLGMAINIVSSDPKKDAVNMAKALGYQEIENNETED